VFIPYFSEQFCFYLTLSLITPAHIVKSTPSSWCCASRVDFACEIFSHSAVTFFACSISYYVKAVICERRAEWVEPKIHSSLDVLRVPSLSSKSVT
jgi:hypothetical protein